MALCAAMAACSAVSTPDISLDLSNPRQPAIELRGLSRSQLRALERASLSRDAWSAILRVSVDGAGTPAAVPVAGTYAIAAGTVRFTPVLPFEAGRPYAVVFDPKAAPGDTLANVPGLARVVSTPAPARGAPVHVTAIYPTGPAVPANLLRMYVEFSGPMGSRPAEDYITVTDAAGKEISGALLPLDTDLWDGRRTRFTVLFDPGRVKRGILPNRAMGRPLKAGSSFTIAISRDWPDAQGQPLAEPFRKTYRVTDAIERPLDTSAWQLASPAPGSRDPLRVTFPSAIDHGLAQRALTVITSTGADVPGTIAVDKGETEWRFTPRDAWTTGDYAISILPALEDPSGNRVGRAFEAGSHEDDTRRPPARLPFHVGRGETR